MQIVRILKRRDASSVVVAIVLAGIVGQAVDRWSAPIAQWLSGTSSLGGGWKNNFWLPLFALVVELVVFELLIRIYTALAGQQAKR